MMIFLTTFRQTGTFFGFFTALWLTYAYGWKEGLPAGAFGASFTG